jgi:hypothetical protein
VLAEPLRSRLAHQLDALEMVLRGALPADLRWRPADGRWSAHENLAHVARHQDVLRERLERILAEDRPRLARYRAEEDEAWPAWAALDTGEVHRRLAEGRHELLARLDALTPAQLDRVAEHPVFGVLAIPDWVEFFLLHEAHHLYTALGRVGEARRARAPSATG